MFYGELPIIIVIIMVLLYLQHFSTKQVELNSVPSAQSTRTLDYYEEALSSYLGAGQDDIVASVLSTTL